MPSPTPARQLYVRQDGPTRPVLPPVVLLHGLAASHHDWDTLLPNLASAGWPVYAPDLPGHGQSERFAGDDYRPEALLAALDDWLDTLNLPPGPFYLVGHSLGGWLAMSYALRWPERIAALALINPFYYPEQINPMLRLLLRNAHLAGQALRLAPPSLVSLAMGLDITPSAQIPPIRRRQIALDYRLAAPEILNIPLNLPDLRPQLDNLRTPTLLVWGDHDMTLGPHTFPRLLRSLPNASGGALSGRGHHPHIEAAPSVDQAVLQFLAERAQLA